MLDGKVLGWCTPGESQRLAETLRHWKVEGTHGVPLHLEIGHVPPSNGGSYPGIYMSSAPSRMVRPVKYLPLEKEDFVGPLEQPYMAIACTDAEIVSGVSTHAEFDPTNILSILANMTPFSDFNQSPRNMYQCQMGKQTMGTPGTALRYRTDNKMYRLQTGQTPVVRAPLHNEYGFDNFPNGTNAVVAVISYTGYDMDDAMIINKSAHERGLCLRHHIQDEEDHAEGRLERPVGQYHDQTVRVCPRRVHQGEGARKARQGRPAVCGKQGPRRRRNLCVAHGILRLQRGTCQPGRRDPLREIQGRGSCLRRGGASDRERERRRTRPDNIHQAPHPPITRHRRQVPRPGTARRACARKSGRRSTCPSPSRASSRTIIINPHAFPSRMTIGMFIESLAGKAGALHGLAQDSTPFKFDEENTAADYFGHQLMKAGYNYHGNEPMYSGITGEELAADIYIGVVYYQRLRHMVNDKYQVRTTGPVVPTTGQPVQGRKRGGGIRVGEMERDALIAHGTAFLLQDRLLNCSDYSRSWICRSWRLLPLGCSPLCLPSSANGGAITTVRCRELRHAAGPDRKRRLDQAGWRDMGGRPGLPVGRRNRHHRCRDPRRPEVLGCGACCHGREAEV